MRSTVSRHCPTCRCKKAIEHQSRTQVEILAELTGVSYAALLGYNHTQLFCTKRHLVIAAFKKLNPQVSYPYIGYLFHRNHASIINACRVARREVVDDLVRQYRQVTLAKPELLLGVAV